MKRQLDIRFHGEPCGVLYELERGRFYQFVYHADYVGPPISLTMPLTKKTYEFNTFPAFFDGLLPEGIQLEALLRIYKIDADDYMKQLSIVGQDLVGAVTIDVMPQEVS